MGNIVVGDGVLDVPRTTTNVKLDLRDAEEGVHQRKYKRNGKNKENTADMPIGWEAKAWELGAMRRESGEIREASSLLRLNMLYTTNEGAFQVAAKGLEMTEGVRKSKTAAHKRIRNSGEWLRRLAQE